MADQDFNIKVVTTADTSGITQTDAALTKLVARSDALRGQLPGLSGGQLIETEAEGQKVAAAIEKAGGNALFLGANLGRARQEAIVLARELGTGGNVTRTLGSLLGALGPEIAIAAVGGFALYQGFKGASEEEDKLIKQTASLGDELADAAKKWQEASRNAMNTEDVAKIAAAGVSELDKIHAKVQAIQQTELTGFQKAVEFIRESFQRGVNVFPVSEDIVKPYTAALRQIKENAAAEEKAALDEANRDIVRGNKFREDLEKRKSDTINSVAAIGQLISDLETKQRGLNTSASDYASKYNQLAGFIRQAKTELSDLEKIEEKRKARVDKEIGGASPAVKSIFQNEQAAKKALAEGREKDAEMFTKTAEAYERGLDPAKKAELEYFRKQYGGPTATSGITRQPQSGEPGGGEVGTGGPSLIGPVAERARRQGIEQTRKDSIEAEESRNSELKDINKTIRSQGGKPITQAQLTSDKLITAIEQLERKFDRYWG